MLACRLFCRLLLIITTGGNERSCCVYTYVCVSSLTESRPRSKKGNSTTPFVCTKAKGCQAAVSVYFEPVFSSTQVYLV